MTLNFRNYEDKDCYEKLKDVTRHFTTGLEWTLRSNKNLTCLDLLNELDHKCVGYRQWLRVAKELELTKLEEKET